MSRAGPFRALNHVFDIECDDAATVSQLDAIYAPLRSEQPAATHYLIEQVDENWIDLSQENQLLAHVDDMGVALEHLIWILNRAAVDSWDGLLLHGGAVHDGSDNAVLVVGRSGAGKSTLVAALVRSGWGYVSDELLPINDDGSLLPHPRSISLAADRLSDRPHDSTLSAVLIERRNGPSQLHLNPLRSGTHVPAASRPALIIVLGDPPIAGPLTIDRLSRGRAVHALCEHSFAVRDLDAHLIGVLRSVASACTAVTLRGGEPDERADRVQMLAKSLAQAP